jgi:4-hydroxy-tetrahydrodipicolinate reductase
MKIGIFGRGKLGLAVASQIAAAADSRNSGQSRQDGIPILEWIIDQGEEPGKAVDVALDASAAGAVRSHIDWALSTGTNLVIGATGWQIDGLPELVGDRIGLLVSPNFSLGVALAKRLARALGEYAAITPDADLAVIEKHHSRKADTPSGTAKALVAALMEGCPRMDGYLLGQAAPGKISVGVVRVGHEVGYHEVLLDSEYETISIVHQARGREVFARGAFRALLWMEGRKGYFDIDDLAADLLGPGAGR